MNRGDVIRFMRYAIGSSRKPNRIMRRMSQTSRLCRAGATIEETEARVERGDRTPP